MGPEASPPHTQKLLLPLSWAGGECAIWPYQMADSFDSLTIIISVFHSPNSQNPAGTFCGGWALVVVVEQLLLCAVCYCRQSPSVILTVFEAM